MSISREQGGSACHFYDLVSIFTSTLSTGQSSDRDLLRFKGKGHKLYPLMVVVVVAESKKSSWDGRHGSISLLKTQSLALPWWRSG